MPPSKEIDRKKSYECPFCCYRTDKTINSGIISVRMEVDMEPPTLDLGREYEVQYKQNGGREIKTVFECAKSMRNCSILKIIGALDLEGKL